MAKQNNTSLRQLAKQIGVSHTSLVKIANGSYKADPKNIVKKILSNITGVMIPAERYQDILDMLNDARFPKFGETSRTASWLYENIENAKTTFDRENKE